MILILEVDYEKGREAHILTEEEGIEVFEHCRINLNKLIKIAKERRFCGEDIVGKMLEC